MDREALAAEIASLSKLDIDELRERWKSDVRKGAFPRNRPGLPNPRHHLPPPGAGLRWTQTPDPQTVSAGR